MHPCYCKTSQCFYPPYNVESTISTGFRLSFFVTCSHHIILYMKMVIFLMVQKSRLHAKHTWVICLWAVKLISSNFEEHISASYWCLPLSEGCQISRWAPLASTWDELSKLDQTLQLSCGTKILERNQTLYRGTKTQRNLKYFRKRWNTANQCLFPVWLHSKGTLRFLYGMYWTVSTKTQ